MKKIISVLLSIILIMSIMPFNIFATEDFDISDYTWEDIMTMSNSDFRELLANFERVYDPFDTYETDPLMDSSSSAPGGIQPRWTSGKVDMSEIGSHELITARACGVLLNDKGFWGGNQGGSIMIALSLSLASILPDKLKIFGEIIESPPIDLFAGHFYDPDTGKNILGSIIDTAYTNAKKYYKRAKNQSSATQLSDEFIENVGRMLHYIQDASEPHHAANVVAGPGNNSHGEFEDFADANLNSYIDGFTTISSNSYAQALTHPDVGTLVYSTAKAAKSHIFSVDNVNNKSQWAYVAGVTTRNAVQYSALALYKLSVEAGIPLTK